MPELPEIYHLKDQLKQALLGTMIMSVKTFQEKCLNMSLDDFNSLIKGHLIDDVKANGKWLFICLDQGHRIGINLGMGGEISLVDQPLEKKHQVEIYLSNQKLLNIRFWWFGHVHFIKDGDPHQMTDDLGIDYFDERIDLDVFKTLLKNRRGSLKNFLLNQHYISGIGNYYIHDILFLSNIHPSRQIPTLSNDEIIKLFNAIRSELTEAYQNNGSDYEEDLYQEKGSFKANRVAYRDGERCLVCHCEIKKIKTGQTNSYYCPNCQK